MDDRPNCNLKCSICKKPDCDYEGDYVSLTEERSAARQDRRAIWYRLTWNEIEKAEKKSVTARKRYLRTHQK